MKKNNKGMSLMEVVIVIAILAILGGLMTLGVGIAVSKPAEECANKMLTSMNNAKITTMGKHGIRLEYYMDDNKVYLDEVILDASGNETSRKKTPIGAKGVKVEFRYYGETKFNTLGGATSPLALSFKRSSGGFNYEHTSGSKYCEEIKITKGSKTKVLKLQYLTGKVTID